MIKHSILAGEHEDELLVRELHPGELIKTSSYLTPALQEFVGSLRPEPATMYTLVNAMGYSEYFGANSNKDYYGYNRHIGHNGLLHEPPNFGNCPAKDREVGKRWFYGYPTFYNATVYAHHQNTCPETLGFGEIIYAGRNDRMKRIELVKKIDINLANKRGRGNILQRIRRGDRVDVSMGCFKAGAMVSMADGTQKPIQDIVVGDRVRTHTGAVGAVTELYQRKYQGEFFEIRPANGAALHATCEHPFWASHVPGADPSTFGWVYARDLTGAVLACPDPAGLRVVPIEGYRQYTDTADVFNFEVVGDNSYLVNGVAAHNCKVPFDLCLDKDTLVTTQRGEVRIADVVVGDEVLTHQNRYRPVTRVFSREGDDGIEVAARGVPDMVASEAHPYYVVRFEQLRTCVGSANGSKRRCSPAEDDVCTSCGSKVVVTPEWVAAVDLRVGDYLVAHRGTVGGTSESLARLAGYFAGDGWLIHQGRGGDKAGEKYLVAFGISAEHAHPEHEANILATIEASDPRNAPKVYQEGYEKQANKVYCYDRGLASRLDELVCHGARGKRLSEEVFDWDADSIREFLSGWADADGRFDAEKEDLRICSVSRELILGGQRLARKLGMRPTIVRTSNNAWFLVLNREDAQQLHGKCLKVVLSDRTRKVKSSLVSVGGYVLHPIYRVSEVDASVGFHNLSVEEDESFVAEGVITHNCSICTDWGAIERGWSTFDATKHAHPGIAILRYHRGVEPIRGLAITRADYCQHMRLQPGQILPDGQRVFVYNDFPRFFDNSFVWIGADKSARVMWFLDSLGEMAEPELPPARPFSGMSVKMAMDEVAQGRGHVKVAMDKEIEATTARVIDVVAHAERDFPAPFLREVAGEHGPNTLLSSLAALGIVLKPHEFLTVTSQGPMSGMLADSAYRRGLTFDTSVGDVDDTFAVRGDDVSVPLMKSLAPAMPGRSSFAEHLVGRMAAAQDAPLTKQAAQVLRSSPMLEKAAQYNGYRLSVLENAHEVFPKYAHVWKPTTEDMLFKTSSSMAPLLLGLGPMIHLMAAHLKKKEEAGEELGTVGSFVANNRTFVSMMTVGAGLRAAMAVKSAGGIVPAAKAVADVLRKSHAGEAVAKTLRAVL